MSSAGLHSVNINVAKPGKKLCDHNNGMLEDIDVHDQVCPVYSRAAGKIGLMTKHYTE